jgi:hypothetical protein
MIMSATHKSNKKPVPAHAYSFSAGILLGISTAALYFSESNPKMTTLFAVATAGCISHGLHDLYKENRLGDAFGLPFFKRHAIKISGYVSSSIENTKNKFVMR